MSRPTGAEEASLSTYTPAVLQETRVEQLHVAVYSDVESAGVAAAAAIADALRQRLAAAESVRVIFAAAPSQDTMLAALGAEPDIDWARVTAFQMDDYVGIDPEHPAAFGRYLEDRIYSVVRPGVVHKIRPDADPAAECARYAGLLAEAPIDVVCLGFGENGHIAFNDPGVADFADPERVKVVELDQASRLQQVNDGCFASLDEVPTHAITLTVPTLTDGAALFGSVSGWRKADAVKCALTGPITTDCPGSVLRRHPRARLFLDPDAAPSPLPA